MSLLRQAPNQPTKLQKAMAALPNLQRKLVNFPFRVLAPIFSVILSNDLFR